MKTYIFAIALTLLSATAATGQQAPAPVSIKSTGFVVKQETDAAGKSHNVLKALNRVLPGDVVVFALDYRNGGSKPVANFVINNPVPAAVTFTGTEERWAVVSVDGGKSFGPLVTLKIPKGDGTLRAAVAADVTAIRWTVPQPIPVGASGKVQFYGVVK